MIKTLNKNSIINFFSANLRSVAKCAQISGIITKSFFLSKLRFSPTKIYFMPIFFWFKFFTYFHFFSIPTRIFSSKNLILFDSDNSSLYKKFFF
jgi:hypothetical protein